MGITHSEVENVVKSPQQIVPGDMDIFVAQSKKSNGLLRIPFKENEETRKILTVYWTSKIEKYWKEEEKNENKIKYDQDADILTFILRDVAPVDAIEEPGGVIVSYGEDSEPVTVEFLNASARRLIRSDELSITLETRTAAAV